MPEMEWGRAVDALTAQYGALDGVLASLGDDDLLAASACRGWTNADLVFHMLLDAQRALVTFNSPSSGPADKDFITYWEDFSAGDDRAIAHARFVRISTAAHVRPKQVVDRWRETAGAAVRATRMSYENPFVTTQGHILNTSDFIATLVVEATVHHLDLEPGHKDTKQPAPPAVSITRQTVDGLLGAAPPDEWDDITYILKVTGRDPLTEDEDTAMGDIRGKLPVFS